MTTNIGAEAEYCHDLVKEESLGRYLSTLLAANDKHRPLLAIYAFDIEISSINRQVSEPAIGEIRLQWWRDAIDTLYGQECDNHPIARELKEIVQPYDLPKHLFTKLIDAHQFDLYRQPMADIDELLIYKRATSVAIATLVCRVLIGDEALAIDHLIEKAGIAYGLGDVLDNLAKHTAAGQCFLPVSLLQKHDLVTGNALAQENSRNMQLVVSQLRHLLSQQLSDLRQEQGRLSKRVLPAFFPASLADYKYGKGFSPDRNLFKHPVTLSQLKMQWFLFKRSLFEQI